MLLAMFLSYTKRQNKKIYKHKFPAYIKKVIFTGIMKKEEYFKIYKEEEIEESKDQYITTGWPKPSHRYRVVNESYQSSIEENYYWVLDFLRYDEGYALIEKITDVFTAAEHSAFFGVAQQRVGLQQDKVSQFLATIGKMIKELFQLVREIRILDERIGYYADSYTNSKSAESAEISLKGIFIDQVEGGAKSPASVYGMSRELQFTVLPDLFFSTHPQTSKEVDAVVEMLQFNRKVKEVLKRKLRSFLEWKEHTYKELKTRRVFTLKYLRQHFDIIKMYMAWVRPYLRNIKRLQSESMEMNKAKTPELVGAFEGSLIEIEFLAKNLPRENSDVFSCVLVSFKYRTRPSMSYQQEGYQRGPLHVGETIIITRGYEWSQEDIDNYKKMRDDEDFELMGMIDASVTAAMEAMGGELEKYLAEAGEVFEKKSQSIEEAKKPKQSLFEPFSAVGKGFAELLGSDLKGKKPKGKKGDKFKLQQERKNAAAFSKKAMWNCYKQFKKSHQMLAW